MGASPWAWREFPPYQVGCCVECGCLCLLVPFTDGRTALFDPGFMERRWLRSILPRERIGVHGYASYPDVFQGHVCPPPERRELPTREARAKYARRDARRREGSR